MRSTRSTGRGSRGTSWRPSSGRHSSRSSRSPATTAEKDEHAEADLLAAIPLLGRDPATRADDLRPARRAARRDPPGRGAVGRGRRTRPHPRTRRSAALVAAWAGASPALRARILDALLARPAWHPELLARRREGHDSRRARSTPPAGSGSIDHPDPVVRARAEKLFAGGTNPDRQKVIDDYKAALTLAGDSGRGKAVFAKACAACHALDGAGHAVGPDLAALANKSPLYLLTEILDPNRNLDSRYVEYQATTKDGRVVSAACSPPRPRPSITLRGQQGKDETILRTDLEALRGTAKSLMPEGLEKDCPKQDMADLLAYLTAADPARGSYAAAAGGRREADPRRRRRRRTAARCWPARVRRRRPADVIRAMVADLPATTRRRSTAASRGCGGWRSPPGGRTTRRSSRRLLDVALPKAGEPAPRLAGGRPRRRGRATALSLEGVWPAAAARRVDEGRPELADRWRRRARTGARDGRRREGADRDAVRRPADDRPRRRGRTPARG